MCLCEGRRAKREFSRAPQVCFERMRLEGEASSQRAAHHEELQKLQQQTEQQLSEQVGVAVQFSVCYESYMDAGPRACAHYYTKACTSMHHHAPPCTVDSLK